MLMAHFDLAFHDLVDGLETAHDEVGFKGAADRFAARLGFRWFAYLGFSEPTLVLPNLEGKTIGIYTLAEAAGSRAKAALEKLFPGCKVVVNSDLVATPQLTSLAKSADMFVFAWKSSSHQAFYCVKDSLTKGEPIWAAG
jgi:hypothetical protein